MRRPNSKRHAARADVTDQWRPRWLVPLAPVALGGVILVATTTTGHLLSGMAWFAVLAAVGALSAIAGRFEAARRGRRHVGDEREAIINTGTMSIAGTVLVIALTGCIAFTLTRGESTSPYTALLAVAGITYAVALIALIAHVTGRIRRDDRPPDGRSQSAVARRVVVAETRERRGLRGLSPADVIEHPVPPTRDAGLSRRRIRARVQQRMVDGERLRYERAEAGDLDRRRRVQRDADLTRRVSQIVPEAVVQRLDRMPDVVRVKEVHEHALVPVNPAPRDVHGLGPNSPRSSQRPAHHRHAPESS